MTEAVALFALAWALVFLAAGIVIRALSRIQDEPVPYDREDSKRLAAERRRLGEGAAVQLPGWTVVMIMDNGLTPKASASELGSDLDGLKRAYERVSEALAHVINRVSTEHRDDEHGHIFLVGHHALRWAAWELDGSAARRAREGADQMTPEELEAANANDRAEALRGALSHRGRRYQPLDRPDSLPGAQRDAHTSRRASTRNTPPTAVDAVGGSSLPPSGENA